MLLKILTAYTGCQRMRFNIYLWEKAGDLSTKSVQFNVGNKFMLMKKSWH